MSVKTLDWVGHTSTTGCAFVERNSFYLKAEKIYVIFPPAVSKIGTLVWEASVDNGLTRFKKGTLQDCLAACQAHYEEAQTLANKQRAADVALWTCRRLLHYVQNPSDTDALEGAIGGAKEVATLMGGKLEI